MKQRGLNSCPPLPGAEGKKPKEPNWLKPTRLKTKGMKLNLKPKRQVAGGRLRILCFILRE